MAKRKNNEQPTPSDQHLVASTAELIGDGANPRQISDDGAAGLRASLKRFGDLSGIVWNRRTGELVTGHQRMQQIRAEYGDREIELIDEAAGLFGIRIDGEHYFPVRVVDWTKAKQRAANVAANNAKIQGTFTKDLGEYLLSVEAELSKEMPGVLDDCLLVELMAAGLSTSDATEDEEADREFTLESHYQVVIECDNEEEQRRLFTRLDGEGLRVKVITV